MNKIANTKRALGMSIVSLLLCFSMLVGTTFAWFTDSVTSANLINQIRTKATSIFKKQIEGKKNINIKYISGVVESNNRLYVLLDVLLFESVTETFIEY